MRHSSPPSASQTTAAGIGGGQPRRSPARRRRAALLLLASSAVGSAGNASAGPIRHGGYGGADELDTLQPRHFEQIRLQPWRRSLEISFAGLLHGARVYGQRITHSPDQPARFTFDEPPPGG